MSSGSYFPSSVKLVEIDKADGKKRRLGIPTVNDRIGQMVCKMILEPELEKYFHEDSYGYRPGKSALEAIGKCRSRCWEFDWVVDLDIKGFFDNINHELMMKAVKHHTEEKWIILYVERWLKSPLVNNKGEIFERKVGTPQGGVASPLLANLFLHYCFDKWMQREFKEMQFERYADDCIVHCKTENQARYVLERIKGRFKECQLEVHPDKTKIVYCKDGRRKGNYDKVEFDFLSYTFKSRSVRRENGKMFAGFNPAISNQAKEKIKKEIRKWKLYKWVGIKIQVLAKVINPILSGWINYYGKYYKSELSKVLRMLNFILIKWVRRKYCKTRKSYKIALNWIKMINEKNPNLFTHWCIASVS